MIPTFNCDEYLVATLESVLGQLEPGMQVEVVDDCSTAGDPERLVRELGQGRVGFFRQPVNVGHTRNFNTCLRRARGELVHLLHGDDLVEVGFYRRMAEHLDTWPDAGAAICRYAIVDEHGVQRSLAPLLQTSAGPLDGWLPRIAAGQPVQPPAVVVRRSLYEEIGGFNEAILRYGEDWEMWVRIAAATTVIYEPEALVSYRKRMSGSLSDNRRVGTNMADMRFVMRSNRVTLEAAGAPDAGTIDLAARRSLSDSLLKRAHRLTRGPSPAVPVAMAAEAVRTLPTPRVVARSALVVGRGVVAGVAGRHPGLAAAARRARPLARRTRSHPASRLEILDAAPEGARREIGPASVTGLPASPPPKRHLMYAVGEDRVLHVYGPPIDRIGRSMPDRLLIDELAVPGVPRLRVAEEFDGRVWLVEQRLHGTSPSPGDAHRWFPSAAAFLLDVAGPPGPPLHQNPFWADHAAPAVSAAAARWRDDVRNAWDVVADLPARVVHGDVQPRNLVLGSDGIGLVDWEGAWRFGLPGLDLVFLALMSAPRPPDPTVPRALLTGTEPAGRPLLDALAALGIAGDLVRPAVTAMLSTLVLGELRRASRSTQRRHQQTPFRALTDELGPLLGPG